MLKLIDLCAGTGASVKIKINQYKKNINIYT